MQLTEQQARQNLQALIQRYNDMPVERRKTLSEADVVHNFIDELLHNVLGWPKDAQYYQKELSTPVGRPDITLTLPSNEKVYVEAKKAGSIEELKQTRFTTEKAYTPKQLSFSTMPNDRTKEEQQAINYAFQNGGKWAILTNFEKFRLFNAARDTLVYHVESPAGYLEPDSFHTLWQLSYENMQNGSLELLSSQLALPDIDTAYLEFVNTWRKRLAQDLIERRKENTWAFTPDNTLDLGALRSVVQRMLDRLVIIRYAEDRLVIPAGTLRDLYDMRRHSYLTDLDKLVDILFRKFDEAHNSALFAKGLVDEASFSDNVLVELIGKLYEVRYRSMPADIMGNTYEQYLGKTLVQRNGSVDTADNLETRKKQGSYYTPQVIVRYIVDNSLGRYLYGTENGKSDGTPIPGETRKTSLDITNLRILDAACGSGSFLIYAYEVLNNFYESEKERYQREFDTQVTELRRRGMKPNDIRIELSTIENEIERLQNHQRIILETHLYGVDLDPQAAEIAVVNLMMRGMERMGGVGRDNKRLPLILNQNVKVGNSLIGLRADDPRMTAHAASLARLIQLRNDLITVPHDSPDHERIMRELEATTAALNAQLNEQFAAHFTDLSTVRPFHWAAEFPEVFFDQHGNPLDNPGFTIVIGNPPWEILKPDLREYYAQFDENIESRLNRQQAEKRIEELDTEDPRRRETFNTSVKTVEQMSAYVRRTDDYQRQGRGDLATHKLFLERVYKLLRHEGRIGYVVPSGIYTDLGTKDLREMLLNEGNIQYIFSFSNERFFFPGVDHRFKFTMLGAQKGEQSDGFWSVFRFNPRVAVRPEELPEFLADQKKLVYVKRESLTKFSPDSLSVMEFQSVHDYEVAEKIYAIYPPLGTVLDNNWNVKFTREFDKTNDRHLFNSTGIGLPVYEGENLGFYGEQLRPPTIWIEESSGRKKLLSPLQNQKLKTFPEPIPLDYESYRFGFRRIASATNARTLYVSYLPCRVFAMYTLTTTVQNYFDGTSFKPYMHKNEEMFLYASMASFVLDFVLRFQVSSSVAMFNAYSLPVPRLTKGDKYFDAIVPRAARLTCTRQEFADLWRQVMGEAWDESKGATDPAERQQLRDEIDAIVAHLYGLSRDDFDHILGTFPLVFPDSAEGRAKRDRLLGVYDMWAGRL